MDTEFGWSLGLGMPSPCMNYKEDFTTKEVSWELYTQRNLHCVVAILAGRLDRIRRINDKIFAKS